jgi:hypothetical protein
LNKKDKPDCYLQFTAVDFSWEVAQDPIYRPISHLQNRDLIPEDGPDVLDPDVVEEDHGEVLLPQARAIKNEQGTAGGSDKVSGPMGQ